MKTRTLKRTLSIILAAFMVLTLVSGCGKQKAPADSNSPSGNGKDSGIKVAMTMQGPISDMSWNYSSYYALGLMEKEGASTSYNENADPGMLVEYARTYGSEGYNLVIMNDDRNQEDVIAAAGDFPNTHYVIVNGMSTTDNVSAIHFADEDQGFMSGVIAALITKTKKVAFVGGVEFSPIINGAKGFEQGVKFIDDSIDVQIIYTGSFTDNVSAKAQTIALIEQGVDVVAPNADAASQGVVEAAQEKGVLAITNGEGMEKLGPDAVVVAVNKNTYVGYYATYKSFLEGKMPKEIKKFGAADGLIVLGKWLDPTGVVTDEVKAKVESAFEALKKGEVKINLN